MGNLDPPDRLSPSSLSFDASYYHLQNPRLTTDARKQKDLCLSAFGHVNCRRHYPGHVAVAYPAFVAVAERALVATTAPDRKAAFVKAAAAPAAASPYANMDWS